MNEALLVAEGIHRSYAMGHGRLKVLRGCNLRVAAGEFVAIMGKSGSGKSTLLHILGALDVPDRGDVTFAGQPVLGARSRAGRLAVGLETALRGLQKGLFLTLKCLLLVLLVGLPLFLLIFPWLLPNVPRVLHVSLYGLAWAFGLLGGLLLVLVLLLLARLGLVHATERRRVRLRRQHFGFVFQFYHLLPELNLLENVMLPCKVGSSCWGWLRRRRAARAEAVRVLERVGLADRLKHRPSELSGGERQRAAVARALVHRPRVLFADEPTGNLDAAAGAELMDLLRELHREGQTIVLVTHDAGIAAQADRVLRLENGLLYPAEARSASKTS